jgi:Domain of Unknown Function (DUF1259)
MNCQFVLSRRAMLRRTGLLLGAASALAGIRSVSRAAASPAAAESKTPPLSKEAMAALDEALGGKKGSYIENEGVYSTPLPRNDLRITIKGEPVPIAFGFGGWVSIKRTLDGQSAMLMSDTVLLEEEVNPLISAAQDHYLQVTAIHNHFFYGALDKVVGLTGKVNGPIYKYVVGRDDLRVIAMGAEVTTAIGLNTWAAFAGESEAAHIAGDVAMLEGEVNGVIRALRKHDLEVVAVHQHMLEEQPRIIFLHYYGRGPASTLAKGFRAALDQLGGKGTHAGS